MIFSLKPSEIKPAVEACMQARLVPFLQSSPGIGKSSIVKQIANEYGLKLIDCRLSSMEPTDLQGLPWIQDGKAQFNPYNFFPLEDTPIPEGYSGWLLFLDEFNSANRATQAAAYRVVLDREIGMHKLHSHCFVVAAGNLATDNAITTQLSTAMSSRVIHLNMEVNFDDWRDNFAIPQKIDERIIAYLSMYPNYLMDFDPERDSQTFACPRTWHFASKLIEASGGSVTDKIIPLLGGAVTMEQANSFVQFCKVYKDLITVDDIKKNPSIEPPKDAATLWAILIHIINRVDKDNFHNCLKFVDKMPPTFKIVYLRSLKRTNSSLFLDPAVMSMITDLGDFCMGD